MRDCSLLVEVLREKVDWHKARLDFMASFVMALIQVRTVNLAQIAVGLNPLVQIGSNYRRCQRFLADFKVDQEAIGRLILALLPEGQLTLCIDRTEWEFGRVSINILFIAAAYDGVAYPLVWCFLGKAGCSNLEERLSLLKRLLKFLAKERIHTFTADREFACTGLVRYVRWKKIPYTFRIKAGNLVVYKGKIRTVEKLFWNLGLGELEALPKQVKLWGQKVYLMGGYLQSREFLLLITDSNPEQAHIRYAFRWEIETLFKAFKSQGFNFEATHLSRSERLENLIALMSIALIWAHRVGEWLSKRKPIPIKNHARKLYSTFRYGLDYLRQILLAKYLRNDDLDLCIRLLSCT
jgi:hypothetical protein